MAKYIADYLTDIRGVLQDNDGSNERWTDPELTVHLAHAVMEVSSVVPTEKKSTAPVTVADSREVDVSAITDLYFLRDIEWPTGEYPKKFRDIAEFWDGKITMELSAAPTASGETVNLYYYGAHSVEAASSTVPPEIEWYIIQIAAIYAMIGFSRHGRDSLAAAMTKFASAATSIGRLFDLVEAAKATLDDAKGLVGEHNQDAQDSIAAMATPLSNAGDDLASGRSIINESSADIDSAIAGSDQRIQKAVEFLETYGAHYINKTNFGSNVPGYYAQYGNVELGASGQFLNHARLLLSRDGASNEWFRAADAGIRVAMGHAQAASAHLAMNQAGRDMMQVAYSELQMASTNLSEAQSWMALGQNNIQIARVIDAYEGRAQYQLAVIKSELGKFRPDMSSVVNSRS